MKTVFPLLTSLFFFFLISCIGPGMSDDLEINTSKASRHKIKESNIISRTEIIPLSLPDDCELTLNKLEIYGDILFVMDSTGDKLLAFSALDGQLLSMIDVPGMITDYSVSESFVDILSGKDIITYDRGSGSFSNEVHLQSSATFTGIARRDKDSVVLSGYDEQTDNLGEYLFDTNHLAVSKNIIPLEVNDIGEVMEKSHFFLCDRIPHFFYSNSGDIWRLGTFFSPQFSWKFDCTPDAFINAQLTKDKAFLSFSIKGEYNTLIFSRSSGRYVIANKKTFGKILPLGTICDDINYYICSGNELEKYTDSQSLTSNSPVLVKYFLCK